MAKTFYWFGVKKLEWAPIPTAPASTPSWTQIPSIEQAQLRASVSEQKVYGDDTLQYTFVHSPETQLQIKLTKFDNDAAEALTGNDIETISGGRESMLMMTNKDLNPPYRMFRVTLGAKDDADGTPTDLHLIFFKCSARPIWDGFGAERGKAVELNWTVDVLAATTDEQGDALPAGVDYAFGRFEV